MKKLPHSVLFVEDEPIIRQISERFLLRCADSVYVAENGAVGLELFTEHRPDLVITDIRMPEMDGLEMSRRIKEAREGASIAAITAHTEPEILEAAHAAGIERVFHKPVNFDSVYQWMCDATALPEV